MTSPVAPPRPRRAAARTPDRKSHDERWSEIVQAATEIFAERGYDATSLQHIAERIGILKGSIYHYIRTKSDLLAHIIRETHEMGLNQVRPIANGPGNARERLERMIRAHVHFVCDNPLRTAVYAHDRKRLEPEQRRTVFDNEHAYRDLFEAVIADGRAEGSFDSSLDVRLSALHLLAAMNALHHWWRPGGSITREHIADHISATTLNGFAAPPRIES